MLYFSSKNPEEKVSWFPQKISVDDNINKSFLQISILVWFLKDRVTLKTPKKISFAWQK